jgi:hypothetical protein
VGDNILQKNYINKKKKNATKKTRKDEKIKSIYASSNICASIYDKTLKILAYHIHNGGQLRLLHS